MRECAFMHVTHHLHYSGDSCHSTYLTLCKWIALNLLQQLGSNSSAWSSNAAYGDGDELEEVTRQYSLVLCSTLLQCSVSKQRTHTHTHTHTYTHIKLV
jgi:hypothetical protein